MKNKKELEGVLFLISAFVIRLSQIRHVTHLSNESAFKDAKKLAREAIAEAEKDYPELFTKEEW